MFNRRTFVLTILWVVVTVQACWAAEPVRVRVLTYNIHHGAGMDGKIDLPRIAQVIKKAKPDLVALQEVDNKTTRAKGVDQAAELGRLTGMHVTFGKAMDYAGGQYGEAILSRYLLANIKVHELPFVKGCEPRAALAATIRVAADGPEILFVGTHLEHANKEVRLSQARALSDIIEKDSPPAILAGDLNAVPDSPPIKSLLEHWTDATADRPEPTFPSDKPRVKIDYVLFRPAGAWRVVEKQVVDEPVASDHRPVLVVLEYVVAESPVRE